MTYSEMKDSGVFWIGDIPSHWDVSKAKYHVVITNGSDPETEGDIPVYGSGAGSFKTCGEYKEGPAVLIGRKGATLHIPHFIEGRYWNADTAFDVKARKGYSLRYFYYSACCFDYKYYISQTTLPSMTQSNYANMKIPAPSIQEQNNIAAFLDEKCGGIDAIIDEAKASIEEYKRWKASVIYQAVTKGLDPDAPMKDSGVPWIGRTPFHWSRTKISRGFSSIGSGSTPVSSEPAYYDGEIPWLQSGDIGESEVFTTSKSVSHIALEDISSLKIYKAPFIAVAMYGASIANVSIICIDACTNQACCVLSQPKEDIYLKFVYYAVLASKKELLLSARGGTQPNISQDIIKQLKIPVPPVKEQKQIASFLESKVSEINSIISEKQSLIAELEAYKKSLIYEAVTGKRKVG